MFNQHLFGVISKFIKNSWLCTCVEHFGQFCSGTILGVGKNRSRGLFLQKTSSSDQKATTTNRVHSNDL